MCDHERHGQSFLDGRAGREEDQDEPGPQTTDLLKHLFGRLSGSPDPALTMVRSPIH
jgi:hypothetical protein